MARTALAAFVFAVLQATIAEAQSPAERALDLKRAEIAEAEARARWEQVRELHEKGIESRFALDKARADYDRARLETVRARTGLANELPALRVISATKSRGPTGEALVTVRVEEMEESYDASIVRRYLVSLMNDTSIISDPYQARLVFSGRRPSASTITFRLLNDVDAVSVVVNSGTRREVIPILLQRSLAANRLQLSAANFSQEGPLGGQVEYTIAVERFSARADDVELVVESLPESFTFEWIDAATGAKLSRLRFGNAVDHVRLTLRVFIPEEGSPAWLGKLLPFRVVAYGAGDRSVRWGELALQLRPVGAPKLAITTGNLLVRLGAQEERRVRIAVANTGGAIAQGVTLQVDLPLGLQARSDPPSIAEIRSREQKTIDLILVATSEAIPGEYTVRVKATTASRMAAVDSPELSFRIELRDARSRLWTSVGIVLLLGTIGGGVVWLSRVLRR